MEQRLTTFFASIMRPKILLTCLLLGVVAFAGLLYKAVKTFDATDLKPPLKHDVYLQKQAIPVSVDLTITDMPEFSVSKNMFVANLIVWFRFDSAQVSTDVINKFSFNRGKIEEKSQPVILKDGTKMLVRYRIKLSFSSPLDHKLFPLNDHILYLTLVNEQAEAAQLAFIVSPSSFYIEPEAETDVWKVIGKSVEAGYFEDKLGEFSDQSLTYPGIVFSLDLAKQGMRKVFIIMLPMLIAFILVSISFLLDPKKLGGPILGLSTGLLTGLIAYRFVIEQVEPNVGYFTFTDHVFNIFLVSIGMIYIVNLLAVRRGEDDLSMRAIKGATILTLQLFLLVSVALLTW